MPPDRMTGFNPWPWDPHHGLSVRCVLWKGVDNLLNHTLSPAGTSGGTDKGSYWTRLGLQPTQVIQVSTNNITTSEINHHSSSLTMLCRAYSSWRGIRDKLVSTQDHDFPGFLPVCKRSSRGWSKSLVYPLLATNNSKVHSCTRLHWYINCNIYSKSKGAVIASKHHNKYYARVQKCLPSRVCKGCTYWKLSFSSKNPILQNTQIQIFQTQYQNL